MLSLLVLMASIVLLMKMRRLMDCMVKNTTKVRNIKGYIVASLFNAVSTMGSYYKAEGNHDMPQFIG